MKYEVEVKKDCLGNIDVYENGELKLTVGIHSNALLIKSILEADAKEEDFIKNIIDAKTRTKLVIKNLEECSKPYLKGGVKNET